MERIYQDLASTETAVRLEAARTALQTSHLSDLTRLVQLRQLEEDSWVRAALDRAIDGLRRSEPTHDPFLVVDELDSDAVDRDIRDLAVEHVTKLIVHECRPLIGRLERRAREEIESFSDSDTAKAIERVREFLRVLEKIHTGIAASLSEEFDLTDVIFSLVNEMEESDRVLLSRDEPLSVAGDVELIRLVLPPLITNALEASRDSTNNQVVVNCGRTDVDAWIMVVDHGPGLPPGASNVWQPGFTTKGKTNNLGWGLAVVETAVRTMRGKVSLLPRDLGGVAAEVRWPQGEASP